MKFITTVRCMLLAAAAAVLALAAGVAFAHEQREGEVQWVVGFLHEPAYEGQINGVYLKLTEKTSGEQEDGHSGNGMSKNEGDEHDSGEATSDDSPKASHEQPDTVPVEGAHETLQVEVTHIPTGASKILNLRPLYNAPGEYAADLIPTVPGAYQFRFFGTIGGKTVEETFLSKGAGGHFDDVRSSVDLQFPVRLPEIREIEGAVRGAQNTAQQAQDTAIDAEDSASSAGVLAIVGIVLGAGGITVGVGGVAVALKRR